MKSAGEKAMALVDGQLAPAEVPALVQELARDATLVAELQDYLATSRSRIGQVFATKAEDPVPHRLVRAVLEAPVATAATQPAAAALSLPRRLAAHLAARRAGRLGGWLGRSCRVPAWSLAAAPTLAAAAAFAVAAAVLPAGRSDPEPREAKAGLGSLASTALGAALERTASGKETTIASVRPMLSFNGKDAGWCRQFEVSGAGRQTSHGLACRGGAGNWRVVALTAQSAAGKYVPAGAGRRKLIDDLVTSMIAGEPLSPEGEVAVIGSGWQL
jgi:hypothetical protein